jgi:uncharacterized protein YegP (UPF0339 family)
MGDVVELYRDRKRDYRWRYKAANGRVLADSAEGYRRPGQARRQAERVVGRPITWDTQVGAGVGTVS